MEDEENFPRRFRWPTFVGHPHPNGSGSRWRYGCYWPMTDLVVTDMGERGTGAPGMSGIEWLDDPPRGRPPAVLRRTPPAMDEMLGRPGMSDSDGLTRPPA